MAFKGLVVILRGIPGSGKSTYAKQMADSVKNCVVCSADDFFIGEDGEYRFNPSKLSVAHNECYYKFRQALRDSVDVIIVDNTNTRHSEYKRYAEDALAYGYDLDVVKMDLIDAETSFKRNTHGVPLKNIQRMIDRFED